jgi:tRNA/rRNA methyltransferase
MVRFEGVVVVLVSTRNPLNLGAAARAMQNFGFPALRAVTPWGESWRTARSAVGAEKVLVAAEEFLELVAAIADCTLVVGVTGVECRNLSQPLLTLPEAAPQVLAHVAAGGRVALLFGSEKFGLSKDDLNHCHLLVTIPTQPEQESMNLGQAVAVTLYELARSSFPASIPEPRAMAKGGQLTALEELAIPILEATHNHPMEHRSATCAMVQQMLRRVQLTEKDAVVLLGVMRKVAYRLGLTAVASKAEAREK